MPILKKIDDCRNWKNSGECKYGDTCRFRHGDGDLRFTSKNVCFRYQDGICRSGERCRFRHVDVPEKLPVEASSAVSTAVTTVAAPTVPAAFNSPSFSTASGAITTAVPEQLPVKELAAASTAVTTVAAPTVTGAFNSPSSSTDSGAILTTVPEQLPVKAPAAVSTVTGAFTSPFSTASGAKLASVSSVEYSMSPEPVTAHDAAAAALSGSVTLESISASTSKAKPKAASSVDSISVDLIDPEPLVVDAHPTPTFIIPSHVWVGSVCLSFSFREIGGFILQIVEAHPAAATALSGSTSAVAAAIGAPTSTSGSTSAVAAPMVVEASSQVPSPSTLTTAPFYSASVITTHLSHYVSLAQDSLQVAIDHLSAARKNVGSVFYAGTLRNVEDDLAKIIDKLGSLLSESSAIGACIDGRLGMYDDRPPGWHWPI